MKNSVSGVHVESQKHKKTTTFKFLEGLGVLVVLLLLLLGVIYHFGAEEIHDDLPHTLNEIFDIKEQKDLIKKLQTKTNQYTALYGGNETGIFEFLEHYADTLSGSGKTVVVRNIEDNIFEEALRLIRITKNYIQQNIDLETDFQRIQWIFVVRNGEIPVEEIENIRARRPRDSILVGSTQKPALKKFKFVKYPALDLKEIQQVIVQELGVNAKQAALLIRYYGTIPEVLHHLDQICYSHQKHLGESYKTLEDLGKKELSTLKQLCKSGQAPLKGSRHALEDVGTVIYDQVVYWDQRVNILNYELEKQVECVHKVASQSVREGIAKKRIQQEEAQARAEKQAQGQQNAKQAEKAKAKQNEKKTEAKPKASNNNQKKTNTQTKQKAKVNKK